MHLKPDKPRKLFLIVLAFTIFIIVVNYDAEASTLTGEHYEIIENS